MNWTVPNSWLSISDQCWSSSKHFYPWMRIKKHALMENERCWKVQASRTVSTIPEMLRVKTNFDQQSTVNTILWTSLLDAESEDQCWSLITIQSWRLLTNGQHHADNQAATLTVAAGTNFDHCSWFLIFGLGPPPVTSPSKMLIIKTAATLTVAAANLSVYVCIVLLYQLA